MLELLNDRYELGDVVGSGGMGAVYRATDLRLGRTVAVKILRAGHASGDVALARMRSEASLAASINHPGVAQVYDYEEDRFDGEGVTFIVMEFVEGHSLAQLLREQGPMPTSQVMSVVVQVAEGLQAAHEAGIIHRDLKPANIMLTPAGRTVLVDFGIARSASSEPLTSTGSMVGTAEYMSPEQSAGRAASEQSDLYALGIVAFHCLTGVSPYRRETAIGTALAHMNDELPPVDVEVAPDVLRLIESMTAKNPSERPTSAAAVALEAARIGAARSIDLPDTFETPVATAMVHRPATGAAEAETTVDRAARRRPVAAVYAGVGALALAVVLLGWQTMRPGDPQVVPRVVGMSLDDARTTLRSAEMTARTQTVDAAGTPAGQVVEQSPRAGTEDPEDASVELTVASGKVRVSPDDVVGLTYAKASSVLAKLGLEAKRREVTQTKDAGKVVALDRSGRLPDGATVTLSVAVAPVAPPAPAPVAGGSSSSGSGSTGNTGSSASRESDKGKDAGSGTGKDAAKESGKNTGKGENKSKGKGR